MANVFGIDKVNYECACGEWAPLSRLYFCRYCIVLRCRDCLTHEVDSIYCSNCMENVPQGEARVKRNRCTNCHVCPLCEQALLVRSTAVPVPNDPQGKTTKAYYMVCCSCRWSTRDAGIEDQTSNSHWPQPNAEHENELNGILEEFRGMASVEKAERDRKKFTKRRSHSSVVFPDRYGLSALMAKKRLGTALSTVKDSNDGASKEGKKESFEATDELPELPDSIFNDPVQVDTISTIDQRHRDTANEAGEAGKLLPVKRQLCVRRSLRCKKCDHNLCKGEYNASSIKFKISLFAIYYFPDVRLAHQKLDLRPNVPTTVHLTVSNLTTSLIHIVMLPNFKLLDHPDYARVEVPVNEIPIPFRDDSADIGGDDNRDESGQFDSDDKELVTFRRGHKIGIKVTVTPPAEHLPSSNVWISFIVKNDYFNTIIPGTGDQKDPELIWLQQTVKINLGKLSR